MNSIEITYKQLKELNKNEYLLIDIRDDSAVNYGMLPGAIHVPQEHVNHESTNFPTDKKLILYCTKGIFSLEKAKELQIAGYQAVLANAIGAAK